MYYVYTLSLLGRPFYVGCTKNPVRRYKDHHHDPCSSCFDLCRFWLAHHNQITKMFIISRHATKDEGFLAETKLRNEYNKIYCLINGEYGSQVITRAITRVNKLRTHKLIKGEIENIKAQINEGN